MSVFGLEQARELLRDDEDEPSSERPRPAASARAAADPGVETETAAADDDKSGSASRRVTAALDDLAEAAHRRLGRRARSLYESGADLQDEVLDLCFDAFDRDRWKPGRVLDRAADFADRSAERLRDWATDEKERDRGAGKKTSPGDDTGGTGAEGT